MINLLTSLDSLDMSANYYIPKIIVERENYNCCHPAIPEISTCVCT